MTGRMQGKIALITGGGTGIGRASAERLAEEGAHVVICGRRPEPLAETAAAIKAKGGSAETVVLNVGDLDAYAKTIADVANRHKKLDVLMNNAMSVTYKTVLDTTFEDWRRDFTINTDAVFVGTREALRVMIPRKKGSIINIASSNGIRAMPAMSSYSASKAALIHFSAVAAMEAAPSGVRVNVIAPGQILTPAVEAFAKADPGRAERSAAVIPMQRSGTPVELANAVLYLASDESTFTTGICMAVDGGKTQQLYVPG
jgi:meso-butanediol dehydrogenase / (S,S)-butanediol dehydrogenase / diacetyl reductase